jgi:alanyl-tRNA synthetase
VARSGARLVVPVLGVVVDDGGEVWHVVEKPLAAGTAVTGRVGLVGG